LILGYSAKAGRIQVLPARSVSLANSWLSRSCRDRCVVATRPCEYDTDLFIAASEAASSCFYEVQNSPNEACGDRLSNDDRHAIA
jgi:hypothetical protein